MAAATTEIGKSGLSAHWGAIEEAYTPKLYWPDVAYSAYDEMRRRDPTIRSALNAVKMLAKQATWTAEPASDKPADMEAAEFLDQGIDDMSHTVDDMIDDALSCLPFGWSSFEIVYRRRNGAGGDSPSKYDDGKIGWRKFAFRRQSSFSKWVFDDAGGLAGWEQRAAPDYEPIFLPIEKLLHFTVIRDGNNPEGMSLLEAAYEPWYFAKNLRIIAGIGWQRTFVGLPVFEADEGFSTTDKSTVESVAASLVVDEKQYVTTPRGVKFRLESVANSGAPALLDQIRHYEIKILQLFMADFMALGTGPTGSFALGTDKSELFLMAVNGYLDRIEDIWNRFGVARLFGYNEFAGITEFPRVRHSTVRKPNLPQLGEFLQKVANILELGEEDQIWIRSQAGMPEIAEDEGGEDEDTAPEPTEPETGQEEGEVEASDGLGDMAHFAATTIDPLDEERRKLERGLARGVGSFLREERDRVTSVVQFQGLEGLDGAFWASELALAKAGFLGQLSGVTQQLVGMSITEIQNALAAGADWALVNSEALAWAQQHAGEAITGIMQTTETATRQAVTNWIASGEELPALTKSLSQLPGAPYSKSRAELIATTEVTKAYAEANNRIFESVGIPPAIFLPPLHPRCRCVQRAASLGNGEWATVWQTAYDERVCRTPYALPAGWDVPPGCNGLHAVIISEKYGGRKLAAVRAELRK